MTVTIGIYDVGQVLVCSAIAFLTVAGAIRAAVIGHNIRARRRLNLSNQACWDMGPVADKLPVFFSRKCLDLVKATCGTCQAEIHTDDLRGGVARIWAVGGVSKLKTSHAAIEAVSLCRNCRSVVRQSLLVDDQLELKRHRSRWVDQVRYFPADRAQAPVDGAGRAEFEEV